MITYLEVRAWLSNISIANHKAETLIRKEPFKKTQQKRESKLVTSTPPKCVS